MKLLWRFKRYKIILGIIFRNFAFRVKIFFRKHRRAR